LQPRPQILFCARPQINQAAVAIFSQFQRGMCVPDVWATPHAVQSAAICFNGISFGIGHHPSQRPPPAGDKDRIRIRVLAGTPAPPAS